MKYYFYKDGSNYGFLYPNDPIINELNLSLDKHTDKMIEQRKKWLEASNKVIKGSKLYNNGINQILLKDNDIILDGYIKGGLSKYDIYLTNDFKNKLINLLIKYSGNLNKIQCYIKYKIDFLCLLLAPAGSKQVLLCNFDLFLETLLYPSLFRKNQILKEKS
jgi:hypothetical protein